MVVATVRKHGESDVIRQGRGLKQDSDIITIVLPDRNGSVPMVGNVRR